MSGAQATLVATGVTQTSVVVTAVPNPDAMEDMQIYFQHVLPILMSYGGQMVYRGKTTKAVVGGITFEMLLVINFESAEVIEELFASPEYARLIPFRDKGFKKIDIVISSSLRDPSMS